MNASSNLLPRIKPEFIVTAFAFPDQWSPTEKWFSTNNVVNFNNEILVRTFIPRRDVLRLFRNIIPDECNTFYEPSLKRLMRRMERKELSTFLYEWILSHWQRPVKDAITVTCHLPRGKQPKRAEKEKLWEREC